MTYYERHRKDKSLRGERYIKPKTMATKAMPPKKGVKKTKKGKKGFDPKKFDKTKAKVFGMTPNK
jgi:hypothetical protein